MRTCLANVHNQMDQPMIKRLSLLASSISLFCACSSGVPRNLADARAAYQRAAQGPAAQLTPAQLHVAQTALMVAEKTYADEGKSQNADDRAYVAKRKAELAEVQAAAVAANLQADQIARQIEANKERDRLAAQSALEATRGQLASEQARRQEAERRVAEALKQVQSASVKEEQRGTVITLSGEVLFNSGKAELRQTARTRLDQVATALKQSDPGARFSVEGYTDSRGSAELNQELSNRRASVVRDYLIARGVPEDRIIARGLGPSNPVADNDTAEGRANNRRVEIVVERTEQRGQAAASRDSAATNQQQATVSPVRPGETQSTGTSGRAQDQGRGSSEAMQPASGAGQPQRAGARPSPAQSASPPNRQPSSPQPPPVPQRPQSNQ